MTRGNSPADGLLSEVLKGRSSQDLSSSELVEIISQLSKYDSGLDPLTRARRFYQLQLLLETLPASSLEEAAVSIASDPDSLRGGSLNTILSALASKDPQRAIAWATEQKGTSHFLASVISSIAMDDPFTAAKIYRKGLLDGTFGQNDGWAASYGIGSAMAKLGKGPLIEYIDSLPRNQQGNVFSNTVRDLPESDRSGMLDEIYTRSKDGRVNEYAFPNIFSNTVGSNPELVEAWFSKMEPGKKSVSLALSTANYLSQINPEASREWMSRAISQSQGSERELLQQAIQQMSYQNPSSIATFASLLPEGVEIRAEDLKNSAGSMIYNNMSGLPDLAGLLGDPAEQAELISGALDQVAKSAGSGSSSRNMNSTDFEIFENRVRNLGLTGDDAQKVRTALEAVRNPKPGKEK